VFVFLESNFSLLGNPKKSSATHSKDFYEKNVPKLPHFEENIFEIVMLENRFQQKVFKI
jgi:hypothetical protein